MASEETAAERWARWHEGHTSEKGPGGQPEPIHLEAARAAAAATAAATRAPSYESHRDAAVAHRHAGNEMGNANEYHLREVHHAKGEEHMRQAMALKAPGQKASERIGAPPSRPQTEREVNQQARVHAETARNASKVADKVNTPEAHTAAAAAHDVAARHAGSSSAIRMHRSEQARHKEAAAGQGRRAHPYPKNTAAGVAKVSEAIEKASGGVLGSWAAKKAGG